MIEANRSTPEGEVRKPGGAKPRRFRWRRVLFWGALAVVAAAVILLSSPYWFPTEWLRRRVEQELERALPVRASVGELSVRLGLGLRVRWRDLALRSEADGARLDLSVEAGEGEVPLAALFGGRLAVPTVTLETVRGSLRVGPEGLRPLLNRWQAKQSEREARAQAEEKAGTRRRRPSFEVKNVLISDLVFSLEDERGQVLQRTPSIDLEVDVNSLAPRDVKLTVKGRTFVATGELLESATPAGRVSAPWRVRGGARLREVNLEGLSDALRLLFDPQAPKVAGVLEEGTIDLTSPSADALTIEATGTFGGLAVESTEAGTFTATRLRVPRASLALRFAKDHLECTLDSLAIEAEAFAGALPPGSASSLLARAGARGAAAQATAATELGGSRPGGVTELARSSTLTLPSPNGRGGGGEGWAPDAGAREADAGARQAHGPTEPPPPVHFAGSRLSLSLTGSAQLSLDSPRRIGGPPAGFVRVGGSIDLANVDLSVPGESEPLLRAASVSLRAGAAEVTGGKPPVVTLSGEVNFKEASAPGLLARLAPQRVPRLGLPAGIAARPDEPGRGTGPAVVVAPMEGKVTFQAGTSGATGEALLRSGGFTVRSAEGEAAVGPWELSTKFSASPSRKRLQLSGAHWSGQQLSLTGRPPAQGGRAAGAPRALRAASSALNGSLSVLPDGDGWSVAASGEGSLAALTLQAQDGEVASADSLAVAGSVGGTYTDTRPHLTALDARASVLGGRANEQAFAGADWLPPGLQSVGVALAGDAGAALKYDGRWFDLSASGTGREVALSAPKLFGPSPLVLAGLRGELTLRLAPDLSQVVLDRCQLESRELQGWARGVVRRSGSTHSLELAGRLATSWSALGPSWLALTERLPTKLHDALAHFSFAGQASLEDVVIKGPLNQLTLAAEVNLDASAVRFDGELLKEAGTRGRMPLRLALGERVHLEDLALDLEGLPRVRVAGDTDRGLSQARFAVTVDRLQMAPLKEVRPELAQLALSGGLTVEGFLDNVRESPTGRARFHFDHLGVEVAGPEPVRLEVDGTVTVTPASIACDDLRVTVDGSDLSVSGRLEGYLGLLARLAERAPVESTGQPPSPAFAAANTRLPVEGRGEGGAGSGERLPQLRVDVHAQLLDLTPYERVLGSGGPPGKSAATVVELVAATVVERIPPTVVELVPPEAPRAEPGAAGPVAIDGEAVVDWVSRWLPRLGVELAASGSVEAAEVRTSRATLDDFKAAWELTDGVLRVDVCGGWMSGGEFDASGTEVHLDRWPPSYTCVYRSFDLEAEPSVTTMVSRRFPGLSFAGHMNDEGTLEGLASPDPQELASSLGGKTQSLLTDGNLLIPLPLPDYVRRLFPSFATSAYHFSTMTNEATIKDGVWHNVMKFDGYPEIYIAGTTDAEGRVDYEAGLRLLKTMAGPAGPIVADVGQLPVAHFTGRIQGTEFVALEGRFATLPELVGWLLEDGLYQGFKKGVLDLGYLRSFQKSVPIPGLDLFIKGLDFVLDVTIRLIPGLAKEKPAPQFAPANRAGSTKAL